MPAAARLIVPCATAALLLAACGSGSGSTVTNIVGGSGTTGTKPTPRKRANRQPRKPAQRRPPGGDLCQSQIGGFLGSMDSLRRRLAVGVTYDQYIDEIRGVRSTYRDVPTDQLRIDCVDGVGIPAEKGFNRYIEAANEWGDCVSELGCGSAEIEPVLQQRWRVASHFLSEAQDGLRSAG